MIVVVKVQVYEWLYFLASQLLQESRHDAQIAPEEFSRQKHALRRLGIRKGVPAKLCKGPTLESESRIKRDEDFARFVIAKALFMEIDAAVEARTAIY